MIYFSEGVAAIVVFTEVAGVVASTKDIEDEVAAAEDSNQEDRLEARKKR